MKTLEVHGQTWQKVSVEPDRFIEALIDDFLGYYQNWIKEDKGSYYIMNTDCHDFDTQVRCITKEEYEYYKALKVASNFLNKQRDAEIHKQREFEEFKNK